MRLRPAPMEPWLRNRIAWFFLFVAALCLAMGFVVMGLDIGWMHWMFPAIAVLALLLVAWTMTAPPAGREYRK